MPSPCVEEQTVYKPGALRGCLPMLYFVRAQTVQSQLLKDFYVDDQVIDVYMGAGESAVACLSRSDSIRWTGISFGEVHTSYVCKTIDDAMAMECQHDVKLAELFFKKKDVTSAMLSELFPHIAEKKKLQLASLDYGEDDDEPQGGAHVVASMVWSQWMSKIQWLLG